MPLQTALGTGRPAYPAPVQVGLLLLPLWSLPSLAFLASLSELSVNRAHFIIGRRPLARLGTAGDQRPGICSLTLTLAWTLDIHDIAKSCVASAKHDA